MRRVGGVLIGVALAAMLAAPAGARGITELGVDDSPTVTTNDLLMISFIVPDPAASMLRNRLVNTPAPGTIVDGPIGSVSNN
ncbi:MAG: hypothetical protein RLO50_20675 [Azospirillaceae bacterium]